MVTAEFRSIDDFSLDLGHVPNSEGWKEPSLSPQELADVDRMVEELIDDYLL